jgi:FtsH-binding integral membrane protein
MYQDDYESQAFYENKGMENYNPRLGFVRKVYGILSVQLLVTTLAVLLAQYPLRDFFLYSGAIAGYIAIACMVVTFITMIMITCCTSMARKVPTNYILLGIFTACESYLVSMITAFYSPTDVLLAAILTFTVTVVLTIYACTTKTDITVCGGLLWVLGWGFFAICFLLAFVNWGSKETYNTVYLILSVAGLCIYALYLIYDTQLIMGGKRYQLTLDDYVLGALVLYIDIIVMFLRILRIIGILRGQ